MSRRDVEVVRMKTEITPGLLVLHGNRLELLREAVFEWLSRQPLDALEEEIFLVQSNGVAEWLKMSLAASRGVCAATRVELPARFLWRCWRQVLGRAAVPLRSPVDRDAVTWRMMAMLPALLSHPDFEPLAAFLAPGEVDRRLQLAQRLADLYDQYQVYRADWLDDWAAGRDQLRTPAGQARPLTADQRWQASLWRELLRRLPAEQRPLTRDSIHHLALHALEHGELHTAPPRRVVVFGMAHLPMQTLQALAALARHAQVILAVPNPCRYHWADIMDGRELLHIERRRQPLREGRALAALPLDALHAHAHPLLAAWGRQGRDFIRQLDAFDDAQAARERFSLPRIDLFDDEPGDTLLGQVQAHIRDMRPLAEHPPGETTAASLGEADRSIVFHVAHSAQRELEILHDQLLALLAHPPQGRPLRPRDIVVMVPDIETVAPAIHAVFGQPARHDPRHIPYEIADQRRRQHDPLLVALEWLLQLPHQRCTVPEVRDLLEVPTVMARLGLEPDHLPRLSEWLDGAQVRWGLDGAQRQDLGLGACGEQNTWVFGLRRMLLGYASGAGAAFGDIEPYGEVAGLEAGLAGSLAELIERLLQWRDRFQAPHTPTAWGLLLRSLLQDFFEPVGDTDRVVLGELDDALSAWLQACEAAGFDEPLPLNVAREAWLGGLDDTVLGKRFMAGGVTFCTLMPMRAVPFDVVCLLGMNEGDYPRQTTRNDIDLMTLPGMRRPGDRARRDDDRYLMLEALLSARRVLYISWAGRSLRDNTEQPPSVLVAQLRDYLAAGWGRTLVQRLTTAHPLQPFSRRYFEADEGGRGGPAGRAGDGGERLFTYAREWSGVHEGALGVPETVSPVASALALAPGPHAETVGLDDGAPFAEPLSVRELAAFLKNPARAFMQRRLQVQLLDPRAQSDALDEDEPFGLGGLDLHRALDSVLDDACRPVAAWAGGSPAGPPGALHVQDPQDAQDPLTACLHAGARRLQRAGHLPLGVLGARTRDALVAEALPLARTWQAWQQDHVPVDERRLLRAASDGLVVQDWLDNVYRARVPDAAALLRLERHTGRVTSGKVPKVQARADRLLDAWVWSLMCAAQGEPLTTVVMGRDALLTASGPDRADATALLADLLAAWRAGMHQPLPVACQTALAFLDQGSLADAAQAYEGNDHQRGEGEELHLHRLFPSFEALVADGQFAAWAERLYRPLQQWLAAAVTVELLAPDQLDAGEETA